MYSKTAAFASDMVAQSERIDELGSLKVAKKLSAMALS